MESEMQMKEQAIQNLYKLMLFIIYNWQPIEEYIHLLSLCRRWTVSDSNRRRQYSCFGCSFVQNFQRKHRSEGIYNTKVGTCIKNLSIIYLKKIQY